ncbi:histidine phosphatase family protein [Paeniglutamicibacter antarcticus]|uniref:Histidine phosphatase family protein n=1 Tax=Arthrobacter terrae TaxID=2935737 RepID=A0A931GB72_9MICC|nr:histidine phosphatase family protein [Arthrobacter terrae]MBG0740442.1 histidine phosphatase family protein [Arthrobacter terrae]
MRLILIRHGQTSSNVRNLLDTAVPGPGLTELGRRQARAIPAVLARLAGIPPLAAIYVSNQTRAQLTAEPLAAAAGLELQIRDGLREIDAGDLEMQGDPVSVGQYVEVVRSWLTGRQQSRIPGAAETGTQTLARFDAVVREASQAVGSGTAVMVSHGAMIRSWVGCRAGNIDPAHVENYGLSNTGIVVLEGSVPEDGSANQRNGERTWEIISWQSQPAGGPELADSSADGPMGDADGPMGDAEGPADGFRHPAHAQGRYR